MPAAPRPSSCSSVYPPTRIVSAMAVFSRAGKGGPFADRVGSTPRERDRRLPAGGVARARGHGSGLPCRGRSPRAQGGPQAPRAGACARAIASATGSSASRRSPPRSITRTSSRSTPPATPTGSCTSRCGTSRATTSEQLIAREGPLDPQRALRLARPGRRRARRGARAWAHPSRRQAGQRPDRGALRP